MSKRRCDFSEKTKRTIAERAGYMCSFPGCSKLTIGPGPQPHQSTNTGMACHIYAASQNGPRGTTNFSDSQIRSEQNGIWCCNHHGGEIDKNQGERYPAAALLGYRALHEARIHFLRSGVRLPCTWLQQVKLYHGPLFAPDQEIVFGKITVIEGDNGSGKTAFLDWLRSVFDPSAFDRWSGHSIHLGVLVNTPEPHQISLRVSEGTFDWEFDQKSVPFCPLPFNILSLEIECRVAGEGILEYFSRLLGLKLQIIRNVVKDAGSTEGVFGEFWIEDEPIAKRSGPGDQMDEGCRAQLMTKKQAKEKSRTGELPYEALSSNERALVLIQVCMKYASVSALSGPTLLILELGGLILDDSVLTTVIQALSDSHLGFQTVLVSAVKIRRSPLVSVARFKSSPGGTKILSNVQ